MPLPASILSLGAPHNATPEMMSAIRAEKQRHALIVEQREKKRFMELADYISAHPESLDQAKGYVNRFLSSPEHSSLHWALREWHALLEQCSNIEIADILRSDSEQTRHLRETSPFARPQLASPLRA